MGRILGITGTPGTGKKSIAPLVSSRVGVPCVALNDFVRSSGRKGSRRHPIEVEPRRLRHDLLSSLKGRYIVYGHLLPDVLERRDVDRVVVLRCDPGVLKVRLLARGYPSAKVTANVEAELIGLIASLARAKLGDSKVAELDTTKADLASTARRVARLLSQHARATRRIDWVGRYASAVKLRSLLSDRTARSPLT